MLVNEWAWLTSRVCLLRRWVQFWSQSLDKSGHIWCVKGMYKLKLISSEKYSGLKAQLKFRKLLQRRTLDEILDYHIKEKDECFDVRQVAFDYGCCKLRQSIST